MVEEYTPEEQAEEQQEDELEDNMERQKDIQEDVYDSQGPAFSGKDDLYSLFWKVVKLQDSSKTANLNKQELGMLDIDVRNCMKIANLAIQLEHPGFAKYFLQLAEIQLSTSLSRDGFLINKFVTQEKVSKKQREGGSNLPQLQQAPAKKKFRFF